MTNRYSEIVFTETQRFAQFWIWLIVGGIAVMAWIGFIQQIVFDRTFGNNPAPDGLMIVTWVAFGILFPVFMYSCCLVTQVRKDGLYYRFKPFHFRMHRILFDEIRSWDAVTYHPIRDYGGWGIRFGFQGKAYNVRGNRGLQVELKNGKRILFGSQKPDEMKLAMDSAGA
jgi:hypothetical protein